MGAADQQESEGIYVKLADNTLREAEETPNVSFSIGEKIKIAKQLDILGIEVIEAGIPGRSTQDLEAVKAVAEQPMQAKVAAIGRIFQPKYNNACLEANVDIIHLSVITSKKGIEQVLNQKQESVIENSAKVVSELKKEGVSIFFSFTDGSRADLSFLKELCKVVEEAGADAIILADTMGILSPPKTRQLINFLASQVSIPISIHCHNDFGLAVANSLEAVQAGARMVEGSFCNLGARVGNANLAEFIMAFELLYKGKTSVKQVRLASTVKLIAKITGQYMNPAWPIVGKRAFRSAEGKGLRDLVNIGELFKDLPLRPEMVGINNMEGE